MYVPSGDQVGNEPNMPRTTRRFIDPSLRIT
jgi:hypothetical protein